MYCKPHYQSNRSEEFSAVKMYHSYWETLEFDIAAIVCVTVLMPLATSFMRMPKAKRAWVAAALLFCAMAYVGIFEGIRYKVKTLD